MGNGRRLWLIDAGYLFSAQLSVGASYAFDYKRLREKLEELGGPLWRAYYLNSTPNPPSDAQDKFHSWMRTAPPIGPKIITKLYRLKTIGVDEAYCDNCQGMVAVRCEQQPATGQRHPLARREQKGVDVGIATLALTLAPEYETLLLSSGDGDLLDAVEHLSQENKRFELAVFKSGVSTELQARADAIYWIDDFAEDVARY